MKLTYFKHTLETYCARLVSIFEVLKMANILFDAAKILRPHTNKFYFDNKNETFFLHLFNNTLFVFSKHFSLLSKIVKMHLSFLHK